MTRAALSLVFALSLLPAGSAFAAPRRPHPDQFLTSPVQRIQSYDLAQRIDVNDISMFVTNIGSFAWDLTTGNPGLEFPKGSGKTAVFAGGLWLGAQVGGEIRATVAEYSQEYVPGSMIGGTYDDPFRPEYKVYKLNRVYSSPAERDAALADYAAGAVPHGAPPVLVLPDGTLGITGDQMLWCVFNDADPAAHTNSAGSTLPLGVEIQQTTFAFNRPGPLGRVVYLRYKILNKGSNHLQDMYTSLWMDPDIGGFTDDLVGCDPSRALGFCYNGGGVDAVYGPTPPAVGVDLIHGPQTAPGARLSLTSFSKYINGTDPVSTFETYSYMRGLLADGSPIVDPTTGLPTTYFHPGDPLTGQGWLDLVTADKRMVLTSGPFTMAPGQEQEMLFAIILGQGDNPLTSLARVKCDEPGVQAFAEAGFTGPEPVTVPCPVPAACPRTASDWENQFDGGRDFSSQDLEAMASCMDEKSSLFDFPGSAVDGFRNLLDSSHLGDPAGAARREYAALLANACATQLRLPTATPVFLRLNEGIACSGLTATYVAQLLETAVIRVEGEYLNLNPAHRRALGPVNFGGSGFGGGVDAMLNFLGSGPDPFANPEAFPQVEIRFDRATTQLGYRYLRLEQLDGSAPAIGRAYLYGGFRSVPFTCWDVTHGVQLDVAFVERTFTDAAGNPLPLGSQPATHNFTWGPDADAFGGREYLFVVIRPYTGAPSLDLAQDGVPISTQPVFSYVLWSMLRSPEDVIDDGDQFRFTFDYLSGPGVDVNLIQLARRPQQDPDVLAAYGDIERCLHGVNGPDAACGPQGPLQARAGADVQVECSSPEGTPVRLDGSASEGGDLTFSWSASGISFDDPHSVTPTGRFPLGRTTVTLEVSRGGEVSRDSVDVTVVDTHAPTLEVALSPPMLWPPNHMLVDVQAEVLSLDVCDQTPRIILTGITSDEPDTGTDDYDLPGDIQGADVGTLDLAFALRSERSDSGDGRTYTVCYEVSDESGNVARQCATVDVPHDQRKKAVIAGMAGSWRLTIHGDLAMPARAVDATTVVVEAGFTRVKTSNAPPSYSDMDGDQVEDAVFALEDGLTPWQVAGGSLFARWVAEGRAYLAEVEPGTVTGVPGEDHPKAFAAGVWPNPARGHATIFFALPREGRVRVSVFDVSGREVSRLVDGSLPAGKHGISFQPGAPQLYLYRVEWEGRSLSGRLVMVQ